MTGDRPDLILPWLFLELGRLAASGGVGAELEAEARSAADRLEAGFPGLSRALKPHLAELAAGYPQPAATLAALKKIIACLERGLEADLSKSEGGGSKGKDGSSHEANRAGEAGEEADNGEGAGGGRPQRPVENILTPVDLAEARRLSLLLQSRLQGLLRTLSVKVNHPGHRGRLDPGSLYKLPIGGSKVFRRSGARANLDTAVYILLDASGSMAGHPIHLAGLAAYSLAEACQGSPGLTLGVGAFPADHDWDGPVVKTILRPGERLHRGFKLEAVGGTPLDQALRQVARQMAPWRRKRKIVIILTDGQPASAEEAGKAIAEASRAGLELFGLGLLNDSILDLLPKSSAVIDELPSLPAALFRLLGEALSRK